MKGLYEIAEASVTGWNHIGAHIGRRLIMTAKNNQDAHVVVTNHDLIAGVVCDGCGSGQQSEIGAAVGARLVSASLAKRIEEYPGESFSQKETAHMFLKQVKLDVLANLALLVRDMGFGMTREKCIENYFLFTVLGVCVHRNLGILVFGLGDGVYCIDQQIYRIGPFENNAPPYLGYGLLESAQTVFSSDQLEFQVLATRNRLECKSILVGSDGVCDLIDAADQILPNQQSSIGPIMQFWEQDRYFQNSELLHRQLALINAERAGQDFGRDVRRPGFLKDDTTLIVIRRKERSRRLWKSMFQERD